MTAGEPARSEFDRSVFVNFPFDAGFLPLLHALIFTIHDCGFESKMALQDVGSGESRIDKIARFIGDCRFSIHDISRIEVDPSRPLPRLNMAFECGLAYGARVFGSSVAGRKRDFLVLAGARFSDKETLSDLGGSDLQHHEGEPAKVVEAVHLFLAAKGEQLGFEVRDHEDIIRRLTEFQTGLPDLLKQAGVKTSHKSRP